MVHCRIIGCKSRSERKEENIIFHASIEMGIKYFHSLIFTHLKNISLNGSIVIDGNNFFYDIYEYSKIPYAYGSEGNKFAKYVKNYLTMFKEANIHCYFVFKGGNTDIEKYFRNRASKINKSYENYNPGKQIFFCPLYFKEIIKEVLDEMKYKYVTCEYEAKNTCIALAQILSCPVVSFDQEFAKSNIDYIPHRIPDRRIHTNIKLINGKVECGVFNLENFMNSIRITMDHFTLFIVLTDDSYFPEGYFRSFFNNISPYPSTIERNKYLLRWLSRNDTNSVIDRLLKLNVDKKQLFDALADVKNFLNRKIKGGLSSQCILGNIEINKLDPEWFEKGVVLQHVDVSYVNMYRSKIVIGSGIIQDCTQPNALLLSAEIIKYAYDLLTNFEGREITIKYITDRKQSLDVEIGFSSERPNYDCCTCVFENGWKNIKSLNLFQHFISVTLEPFDFSHLENAPEDTKLLIIALVYFSRQKGVDTSNETISILMSYVLLSNVSEHTNVESETEKTTPVSTFDKKFTALHNDCRRAMHSLKSYFQVSNLKKDFDFNVLHPLSEFQHCLHELNKLNILCGKPYKPTIYSKTYNGSFVYNFLLYLKNNNGIKAVNSILHDNILVLEYFFSLWCIFTEFE